MIRVSLYDPNARHTHLAALKAETLKRLEKKFLQFKGPTNHAALSLKACLVKNIDVLLAGTPAQLRAVIAKVQADHAWFHAYAMLNARENQRSIYVASLADIVKAVHDAFDYDKFSDSRSEWCAYQLVIAYKQRLCPYCNLNHVNYHTLAPGVAKSAADPEMRPPLDHYYPRAIYPYLGISIHNLIPCCHQCNSSVKLGKDPLPGGLPHPFEIEKDAIRITVNDPHQFRKRVAPDNIEIVFECTGPHKQHVDFFSLPARYAWYKHEVADMHSKYLSLMDVGATLRPEVKQDMVLPFAESECEQRALGICLTHIFDALRKSHSS